MRCPAVLAGVLLFAGCVHLSPTSPVADRTVGAGQAEAVSDERAGLVQAALSLPSVINENYAYLDRLPGRTFTLTRQLEAEAQALENRRDLLRFLERSLMLLADHHAHTGSSFADSWALVPSYSDIWVERQDSGYVVTDVRAASPAARAGIAPGDRIVGVGGVPIDAAIAAFWSDLGAMHTQERRGFAARVLVAGRRDRPRRLSVRAAGGEVRDLELPSLYQQSRQSEPLHTHREAGTLTIRFSDSLGDGATIAAFDQAMEAAGEMDRIVLDLTDTPGGGNTTVARAIMGWFAAAPTAYQMHEWPAEERRSGIVRRWQELVLPRAGMHFDGPVEVRVGRWTGSMGEGLAIGMAELGACISGRPMAGLLGAITGYDLGGVTVRFPFERLSTVDGTPREAFVPSAVCPTD